jgi:hypothetical protein
VRREKWKVREGSAGLGLEHVCDGDPMGARIEVKSTDDGTNRAWLA